MSAEGGNDQNNNCRRKRRGIMMRPVNYLQLGEMFILKQYPVKHYKNYKPFFPRQQADTRWVSEWVLGFSSLRGLLSKKLETVMVAENIYMSPAYLNTLTDLHKKKQIFIKQIIFASFSPRNLRLWWWHKIYMFSGYMDTLWAVTLW